MRRTVFGKSPLVAESAFVAENATLVVDVRIDERAVVMYGAVLRADRDRIVLGAGSNLQDNVTVHGDPGHPAVIGCGVSVGHNALLHGCTVEDDCLIGMSATVLNGAVIGRESLVAAGAVVLAGTIVPPRSLVAGVPATVKRELTADEVAGNRRNAETYQLLAAEHRAAAGHGN
jgi:carbonic anhydrase/acetyltransferase-like protein (isoleucine patch superfamily)